MKSTFVEILPVYPFWEMNVVELGGGGGEQT